MGKNISSGFGWAQGQYSPQPHVGTPGGTYEEEHGRNGFFGRTSHLYHKHPPTGWLRIEGDLKLRSYYASRSTGGAEGEPTWLLENKDVQIGIAKLEKDMSVFSRNGDGDEVRFIHAGSGTLETDYGDLVYSKGDYIVVPRGVTYRFTVKEPNTHLTIQSATEVQLPDRGMLGRHAQFDPMIMRVPQLTDAMIAGKEKPGPKNSEGEYELRVKRESKWTKVFYPFNPINTTGWKGELTPLAINVSEIRPIVSPRYHLPPSVHTTFLAKNYVICSFLPRPLESEEGAMKVPFYHRNIEFDEVLFYHEGNFFSREGIEAGAITFHPQGIHHGPHPNAAKNAEKLQSTEEIAVMVDALNPLHPTAAAESVEWKEYHMSWKADQKR